MINFWSPYHHHGTGPVMAPPRAACNAAAAIAHTIRFPPHLRERIAADAERYGRSFEAHVIAILRRHFGEDVDIAPAPRTIIALAKGSLAGLSRSDQKLVTARLVENDSR